uniref:TRAP transporter small permease protein n=1 Tax=Haliea sp. ETY-M TaxID=1055105 RepID=A0A455R332_9GAMM|nr:TRAP-type C4-dicarboxylate transport system, small permease component [Haliea sp. ETY-M]
MKFLDRHFEELLAGAAFCVMTCMVFGQVIMRYVFSAPLSWSDEIAAYCMVWSVYLSASWAVRERAHVRVFSLLRLAPRPMQQWLIYGSDLIWIVTGAVVSWQGLILFQSFDVYPYRSPVLGIDQKWPYLIVAFGFGLMTLRLLQTYYRHLRHGECLDLPDTEERATDDG